MEYYNQHKVGERIKQARVNAKMTQRGLAEAIDISENHIYRMENGKSGHTVDKLVEIAQILDVSTDYLLLGKDESDCNTGKLTEFHINMEKSFKEITSGKSDREVAYAMEVLKSILSHTDILTA